MQLKGAQVGKNERKNKTASCQKVAPFRNVVQCVSSVFFTDQRCNFSPKLSTEATASWAPSTCAFRAPPSVFLFLFSVQLSFNLSLLVAYAQLKWACICLPCLCLCLASSVGGGGLVELPFGHLSLFSLHSVLCSLNFSFKLVCDCTQVSCCRRRKGKLQLCRSFHFEAEVLFCSALLWHWVHSFFRCFRQLASVAAFDVAASLSSAQSSA